MRAAPRVTYLITSYKLPDQVLRLAATLRRGSATAEIAIHHDDRECRLRSADVHAVGATLIQPPSPVSWGEFSQQQMILRCLSWVLTEVGFDWMVLLSGQDYPVRRVAEIEESLGACDADALIEARPCQRPGLFWPADEFAERYFYRWHRVPGWVKSSVFAAGGRQRSPVAVRSMPSGVWLGFRALTTPFSDAFVCHRGSDWFTLSRAAVQSVVNFCQTRPDVLSYYARTLIPTESFVQTVLANDRSLRLTPDYRRYTFWDERNMTGPRIVRQADLELLLESGADFARKFDETVDRKALDEIDRRVHNA